MAVFLEQRVVSRKTPLDGKLELSGDAAGRLETLGDAFPVVALGREDQGRLESMECTCAKAAAGHVHHFMVSPLFRELEAGSEVSVVLDETRGAVRVEPARSAAPSE